MGTEAEACYPGKIWLLVTLRYRKVNSQCIDTSVQRLKRNVFTA